jgi:hypothetical protein
VLALRPLIVLLLVGCAIHLGAQKEAFGQIRKSPTAFPGPRSARDRRE